MAKMFIICGHGAGDPGACANGFSEAAQVRKLAARMQALGGSEVIVGDMSRNWYKDNGIGRGHCPKGVPVIELHMDSAGAGAKGGHVIIKDGFSRLLGGKAARDAHGPELHGIHAYSPSALASLSMTCPCVSPVLAASRWIAALVEADTR